MEKLVRVLMATPFGANSYGGIDRLTDLVVAGLGDHPELEIDPIRLVTRGPHGLVQGSFVYAAALARFGFAAKSGQIDLLHINLAAGGSAVRKAMLGRWAKRLGVPYVVHVHSGRFDRFWASAGPRLASAIDRLFAESDAIIVLGEYWARFIVNRVPSAAGKIAVLPNATVARACDRNDVVNERVRITFLGKLGPMKGTPHLLEALASLQDRKDWMATIAGNGEVEASRQLATTLGIADRVVFPGWLDAPAAAAQLRQSDIFVLPSLSEGLPMAILEAFAWGIPVVATPVGSIPEVIEHGRNGLLVPVADGPALADALRRLIADPQLRERLGRMALQDHAERFDINVYLPRLAALWRRAATGNPRIKRRRAAPLEASVAK